MLDLHVHDAHFIRLLFGMPDRVTSQVFSLPLYPAMADADVERVADALRRE